MNDWRKIQKENFTSLDALCDFLELDFYKKEKLLRNPSFPLNLPRRLASKMQKNNLEDPLFKQFVPLTEEAVKHSDYTCNPVGDIEAFKTSKCLQKYEGRVLLLPTSACAMHCRFCFRKHFPYDVVKSDFTEEIAYIEKDSSIQEIILSGGDPLSLSNRQLEKLISQLSDIPHVKRLRFHTRFPIGIPERIDESFLGILQKCSLQTWFVLHCNHPLELDEDVIRYLKPIQKMAIPVLTHTVLLKGVNDTLETLQNLFETLTNAGIVPYYLNQLDKTQGTRHFEVDEESGKKLFGELQTKISGYAVPRYAKEEAGKPSKSLILS